MKIQRQMNKQLIPGLVFLFVLITSVSIYFQYSTKKTNQILEQLNKEYPAMNFNEELEGVVTDVYHANPAIFRNNPHHAYVTLDNSLKLRIHSSYELVKEITLDDALKIGSKLVKSKGTDIFQLREVQNRDTLVYTFELRDDLGYPLIRP